MQIKIDLKIFIFALIFIFTRQIKIFGILMIFALIHEIGHLLAGLIVGFKPKSLRIAPYGFSINFKTTYEDYNTKVKRANLMALKKIFIASAGPFTNLLIILITYLYYAITKNTTILLMDIDLIIYSNILIFIFNLIPIYPLDGGRILKEITCIHKGIKESYIYINKASNVSIIILTILSSLGILLYKNIAILVIILYLWYLVVRENKYYLRILSAINVSDGYKTNLKDTVT